MWQKISSVGFIFLCSYWRHTYYVDFLSDDSLIVRIGTEASNSKLLQSVLIYFILFGLANLWIAFVFKREQLKFWIIIYVALFTVAALFIGLHYLTNLSWLFSLGVIVKNFLLSPIFPLALFVVLYRIDQQKTTT